MPKRPALPPLFAEAVPPIARLPAAGSIRFELARRRLATLAKREPEQVSDADVREFLAREQQGRPVLF